MKKRLLGFGAAVIAAMVAAVGLQVTSASAAQIGDWCNTTDARTKAAVCVADSDDGGGAQGIFKSGAADLMKFKKGELNDRVSVIKNNSPNYVYVYSDALYKGTCSFYKPGETYKFKSLNDKISSIRVGATNTHITEWCKEAADVEKSGESANKDSDSDSDERAEDVDKWAWCEEGWYCVADNEDGTGLHAKFKGGAQDLGTWKKGVLNDKVSGAWNRTKNRVYIYEGANYAGACYSHAPGQDKKKIKRLQDSTSSVKVSDKSEDNLELCSKENGKAKPKPLKA